MINFIQKYKHGDALFKVLNVDNVNRIIDVLVNIKGDGCLIEKPCNAEGRNWKIIFDGKQSDTPKEGANADPEEPKPLDYLIRFVAKKPRESQYGDFAAQTDFNYSSVSQEWLRDTMIPLGYCYLTFNANGGTANTSKSADNISTGFSLKAQRRNGDKLYRLAHGNQHAAMMMQGDGNSIQIDTKNYTQAPAYILREWNDDDNYITIPKAAFGSGYDLLHYDTYLAEGERRIDHPAEIKFASLNKAFFEDLVFHVTAIVKSVIDENICTIVFENCLTNLGQYQAKCLGENSEEIPFAATVGWPHGGWTNLDTLPGIGDGDDLAQLLEDVQELYDKVDSWNLPQMMTDCQALLDRMDGIEADFDAYAASLTQAQSDISAAITSLRQTAAELDRMDSVATSQEQRVEALKQTFGA